MSTPLRIGISTCPNDTFAFHALLTGEVRVPGVELAFELRDIEELNERMQRGALDVAKVSAFAALRLHPRVTPLASGWALGQGMGPVVLGAPGRRQASEAALALVLAPGEHTTATLLWRLFHPEPVRLEQCTFSEILPALEDGRADLGVCIHEARFTWQEHGLALVEDLGATWEARAGGPLPLGGPVARSTLAPELRTALSGAIRASIEWGLAHPGACLATMRRHAQEQDDAALRAHVDLYVNEWTVHWGSAGPRALALLADLARERGLLGVPENEGRDSKRTAGPGSQS